MPTVLPASAVPLSVAPLLGLSVGVAGAVVSIVTSITVGSLVLPSLPVCVTTI